MHDLDRTQLEAEQFEYGESESESEAESFLGSILGSVLGSGEIQAQQETPLTELQEMELATELLEVSNEQEFEQFLGDVLKSVGQAAGQFVRSDTGRALTGILRNAAKQALPVVGGAIGGWVSPGGGATVGRHLAQQAGSLLGLELEGLSPQDQEFEAARQFVRFASSAYRNGLTAPPQAAVAAAARQFAPGLLARLAPTSYASPNGGPQSGRWVRRGNAVVLFGL